MSEHLYTYIDPPSEKHLSRICDILDNHGVIALPMKTNWAFCCKATSKKGIAKIRQLKPNHPEKRPFSLVCSDLNMVSQYAQMGGQSYRILRKILPGAYTIILKSSSNLTKQLHDKRRTVGVRIPNEEITKIIIERFGEPILATSVPLDEDGQVLQMGYQVYEKHGHGLSLVIDLGDELPGTETIIFDMSENEIILIREGVGSIEIG